MTEENKEEKPKQDCLEDKIKETDLTPAELKAIEDHKYFMGKNLSREVSLAEAVYDFFAKIKENWLREKTLNDAVDQIKAAKTLENPNDTAVLRAFAEIWRKERESLENNGFYSLKVVLTNEKGLHLRPSITLVDIAKKHYCDLYMHKQGMDLYNFKLNGKPYMNVRSVLNCMPILELAAAKGDTLEFIAYGDEASKALDDIKDLVTRRMPEEL
ncbi:HPr family phosphocarrier protein [Candidatus Woesearchaeota archaeon]|nr:HPr family phosphocarrier protein [Candidatus Woesearchaeota archaeon]